jgi:hypothetical protein
VTPIIDENKAMAETMEAYSDMRRGIGTEQYKHFVARIVGTDSYSKNVKVLKTQPKKQVTKYKLSGIVGGLTMQPEMFDSEHEADEKRKNYEYKFNFGEVELKIEPVVEYVDEEKI